MKKMHEQYLDVVGKGFTFNQKSDLEYVAAENEFSRNLSFEQCVELVEGLDQLLVGNKTI